MSWLLSFSAVEKVTEREKLLGADADAMPKLRSREEIIAKYRKAEVICLGGVRFNLFTTKIWP